MARVVIEGIREQIVGIDTEVTLLDGTKRPYINFDNGSTTPCLRPVLERVSEFLRWYGSIGRGAGFKSEVSSSAMDEARRIIASFVGADPNAHTVLFTKNTTEAINKIARRFPFSLGDVVLCSLMEHHSNDLPWRAAANVQHIGVDEQGRLDRRHLSRLLLDHAGRVRLVAVTGGSNVTGYLNPIHEIAELAHKAGAQLLVDGAQLAAHRRIDMGPPGEARSIDYLAFCAHKMYAPFGVGVLVGLKDVFMQGDPDCVGGGTVDLVTVHDAHWSELPEKEEAGSPNAVGVVALAEAIRCLQEMGLEQIAQHEAGLTSHLLRGIQGVDGVSVYGDQDPNNAAQRLGVVPIEVEGMPHQLVAAILAAEGGIGMRSGLFCAHPYMLALLGYPSEDIAQLKQELGAGIRAHLPGYTRASFGIYNTEAEVDMLVDLLKTLSTGEFAGQYKQDERSGAFYAEGFKLRVEEGFVLDGSSG